MSGYARMHELGKGWHDDPDPAKCRECVKQKTRCERKLHRFDNQQDAAMMAVTVNVQTGYERRCRPYLCRWCGLWHITSSNTYDIRRNKRRRELARSQP